MSNYKPTRQIKGGGTGYSPPEPDYSASSYGSPEYYPPPASPGVGYPANKTQVLRRQNEPLAMAWLVIVNGHYQGQMSRLEPDATVVGLQWGELDYLIIDLPPGTGDEPLSVADVIKPMDGSVIVTTPQDVALLDSRKSVVFSQQIEVPVLGIIENMSGFRCPHCNEAIDLFKQGGGRKAAEDLKVPFLGAVPLDPQIVVQGDAGKPFVAAFPETPAAKAFTEITAKMEAEIK